LKNEFPRVADKVNVTPSAFAVAEVDVVGEGVAVGETFAVGVAAGLGLLIGLFIRRR
jgi:predicted RecB family endonuclease